MSKQQPKPKKMIAEQEATGRVGGPVQAMADEHQMLADGQLRGVNEDGQIVTGMHGGPGKTKGKDGWTVLSERLNPIR